MDPETVSLDLPMKGRCVACGTENVFPTRVTIPVNFNIPLIVPVGEVIGENGTTCPICGQEVRATGGLFLCQKGEVLDFVDIQQLRQQWHIRFLGCVINSQQYGSTNEHMSSVINFAIKPGDDFHGEQQRMLSCIVRQAYGESFTFETSPIEVENPPELIRRINHSEFQSAVEHYFRSVVGNGGAGFMLNGATNITMENITLSIQGGAVIHAVESGSAAW